MINDVIYMLADNCMCVLRTYIPSSSCTRRLILVGEPSVQSSVSVIVIVKLSVFSRISSSIIRMGIVTLLAVPPLGKNIPGIFPMSVELIPPGAMKVVKCIRACSTCRYAFTNLQETEPSEKC